eukprot:comp23630_c0_seq1/m.40274 comp23630_c0_seq1/g.40274  ORF comp23630_c0_seq1/g.40274 comp23630_c0_seq1/m.40274 type:complete len:747 (-) comp23630_c0_seq1:810-3050(-)
MAAEGGMTDVSSKPEGAPGAPHQDDGAQAEPVLTGDELKEALKKQLEYYFSRDNLAQDAYLVSQMNADLYVPISTVASFKMVRSLTEDLELIVEVLKTSPLVQVDEAAEKVRPVASLKRTTLILREVPEATDDEVKQIFANISGCPHPVSVRSDIGNTWFVQFESEDDTLKAHSSIMGGQFKGKPLRARIKSENLLRSSSFAPKNGVKKPFVPPTAFGGEKEGEQSAEATEQAGEGAGGAGGYSADMYYSNQMFYQGVPWMPYYAYDPSAINGPMMSAPSYGAGQRNRRGSKDTHGGRKGGQQGGYYKRDGSADAPHPQGRRAHAEGSQGQRAGPSTSADASAAPAPQGPSGRMNRRPRRNSEGSSEKKEKVDQKPAAAEEAAPATPLDEAHFPPLPASSADLNVSGSDTLTAEAAGEKKPEAAAGTKSPTPTDAPAAASQEKQGTEQKASAEPAKGPKGGNLADIVKQNPGNPDTPRIPSTLRNKPAKEAKKPAAKQQQTQQHSTSSAPRGGSGRSGQGERHEGGRGHGHRRGRQGEEGEWAEGEHKPHHRQRGERGHHHGGKNQPANTNTNTNTNTSGNTNTSAANTTTTTNTGAVASTGGGASAGQVQDKAVGSGSGTISWAAMLRQNNSPAPTPSPRTDKKEASGGSASASGAESNKEKKEGGGQGRGHGRGHGGSHQHGERGHGDNRHGHRGRRHDSHGERGEHKGEKEKREEKKDTPAATPTPAPAAPAATPASETSSKE